MVRKVFSIRSACLVLVRRFAELAKTPFVYLAPGIYLVLFIGVKYFIHQIVIPERARLMLESLVEGSVSILLLIVAAVIGANLLYSIKVDKGVFVKRHGVLMNVFLGLAAACIYLVVLNIAWWAFISAIGYRNASVDIIRFSALAISAAIAVLALAFTFASLMPQFLASPLALAVYMLGWFRDASHLDVGPVLSLLLHLVAWVSRALLPNTDTLFSGIVLSVVTEVNLTLSSVKYVGVISQHLSFAFITLIVGCMIHRFGNRVWHKSPAY